MNLIIASEMHFISTPDKNVWTQIAYSYKYWERYLNVFDFIYVVARIKNLLSIPIAHMKANGNKVSFISLPDYIGPIEFLFKFWHIAKKIKNIFSNESAYILRIPSPIGEIVSRELNQKHHPYGVEVVGDPFIAFAPGAVRIYFRPFFRWWLTRSQKHHCLQACATAYVTERALQVRYPSAPGKFSTHYSSIELPKEAFVKEAKNIKTVSLPIKCIFIGSLSQLYKAPDILIKAVAICIRDGLNLELIIIGDGKHRHELVELSNSLMLTKRIRFLGELPAGNAIREQLDKADIFILPSKTEGLPRSMIEAMARSLPCIGTNAGGISELLLKEDMVPIGDIQALARKIQEVANNRQLMARMAIRNLTKAKEYCDEYLQARRNIFYQVVKDETNKWLARQKNK